MKTKKLLNIILNHLYELFIQLDDGIALLDPLKFSNKAFKNVRIVFKIIINETSVSGVFIVNLKKVFLMGAFVCRISCSI